MWQKYKFNENIIHSGSVGKSRFWVEKRGKIWQVAISQQADTEAKTTALSPVRMLKDGIDWSYHVADKHNNLQIVPATPDRPLVVKPVNNLSILPGMNLELYLAVPLWIQLYASSVKKENLLVEFPESELSSTWFGDPDNGELAYSYPGEFSFELKNLKIHPGEAICPVRVKNETNLPLDFQRLAVPVEQLNIYFNGTILCTNEVQVRHKGEDKGSEIHISGGIPAIAEGLKMLNSARVSSSKNILKKSFSFIKSIADY